LAWYGEHNKKLALV